MPMLPYPRDTMQSSQPNIHIDQQIKSFLEEYLPNYAKIENFSQEARKLLSSGDHITKLGTLLLATEYVSRCIIRDKPSPPLSAPFNNCDAAQDLIVTCARLKIPYICCLSDGLPNFRLPALVYVMRCLVAQLYEHTIRSGKRFTSPNFSDIETESGTLKRGIAFIDQLLNLRTEPCVIIMDNFQALYERSLEEPRHDEGWTAIFRVLQLQRNYTNQNAKPLVVKLFIRTSGPETILVNLGFRKIEVRQGP